MAKLTPWTTPNIAKIITPGLIGINKQQMSFASHPANCLSSASFLIPLVKFFSYFVSLTIVSSYVISFNNIYNKKFLHHS